MKKTAKRKTRRGRTGANELQGVPGIGPSIAGDLNGIGITRVAQLSRADPQKRRN